MEVEAREIVEALAEKPLGILLSLTTVESAEGGDVELELDVLLLQTDVIAMLHKSVTLGMGKNNMIAAALDAVDHIPEVDGLAEIARLYQQMVAIVGDGQQITVLQATLKQAVEHVFGT